jgi:hypothetical protein
MTLQAAAVTLPALTLGLRRRQWETARRRATGAAPAGGTVTGRSPTASARRTPHRAGTAPRQRPAARPSLPPAPARRPTETPLPSPPPSARRSPPRPASPARQLKQQRRQGCAVRSLPKVSEPQPSTVIAISRPAETCRNWRRSCAYWPPHWLSAGARRARHRQLGEPLSAGPLRTLKPQPATGNRRTRPRGCCGVLRAPGSGAARRGIEVGRRHQTLPFIRPS